MLKHDELDEVGIFSIGVIILDEDLDFISSFGLVPHLGVVLLLLSFLLDLESDLCLLLLLEYGSLSQA